MTPLPQFPPYDARQMAEPRDEGMSYTSFDDGMESMQSMQSMQQGAEPMHQGNAGPVAMAETLLGAELLGTLCRRSRRRLRDIQASCQVVMKLDRARHVLRIYGPEACIEAAQKQLSSLGGPRKTVPAAVWAELMRTRTLQNSQQATVLRLQELSGCRIHIERTRHEVRIFGPEEGVVVAEKLIADLEKQCVQEAVPAQNPGMLCMASLQDMAHALGVTLHLEEGEVVVLGLEERVKMAAREIMAYAENPQGYSLQLSPEDAAAIGASTPTLSVEGLDLCDLGLGAGGSRGSSMSSGSDCMQMPMTALRTMAQPPQPMQQAQSHKQGQAPRGQQGNRRPPVVAARQQQAFEQLRGPQAHAQGGPSRHSHQECGVCPTCGVGRFCLFCGHQTWVYNVHTGAPLGWRHGELGAHCAPVPMNNGHAKHQHQASHGGNGNRWQPQGGCGQPAVAGGNSEEHTGQMFFGEANQGGSGNGWQPLGGLRQPAAAGGSSQVRAGQMFFGEAPDAGSTRMAPSAHAMACSGAPGDVSPVSSPTPPMMRGSRAQGYATMEALDNSQCGVGAGANGMVMGGMVPMCFSMSMAPDQNSQMPWVGSVPVTMAQGYADSRGNGNQMMRHVYMVPAYTTLREEPSPTQL